MQFGKWQEYVIWQVTSDKLIDILWCVFEHVICFLNMLNMPCVFWTCHLASDKHGDNETKKASIEQMKINWYILSKGKINKFLLLLSKGNQQMLKINVYLLSNENLRMLYLLSNANACKWKSAYWTNENVLNEHWGNLDTLKCESSESKSRTQQTRKYRNAGQIRTQENRWDTEKVWKNKK